MDKALRLVLILLVCGNLPAQILRPILGGGKASSPTNIGFVGAVKNQTFGTTNAKANTCVSTSDRLVIVSEVFTNTTATLSLTDTGGQAAGATVLVPSASFQGLGAWAAWNAGCAAGSNTFTVTQSGSSQTMTLMIVEYSGLSSGAGSSSTALMASGGSISGTASQAGMLAFVYASVSNPTWYASPSSGFNLRTWNQASVINGSVFESFDNLGVNAGPVSFSTKFSSGGTQGFGLILIPGIASPSPKWYPTMVQTNTNGNNGTFNSLTLAFNVNVSSGHVIAMAYTSNNNVADPSSVTDTLGTTYTLQVKKVHSTDNTVWIYTGVPSSSGPDTITVNCTGSSNPSIQASEFATAPIGVVSDTGGQTTSSGTMTWPQTVGVADSIAYLMCTNFSFGQNMTVNAGANGWTSLSYNASGSTNAGVSAWARTISTSSLNPSVSIGNSVSNVCASIVFH